MINFIRTSKTGNILGLLLFISVGISAGCSAEAESKPSAQTQTSQVEQREAATTSQSPEYRMSRNPYSEMPYDDDLEYSTPAPRKSSPLITKTGFQKIKVGMTLAEVEKLLGESGMLVSTMDVNGRQTQIYKWSSDDFNSYIDVTIENGKVIGKKDKNLK